MDMDFETMKGRQDWRQLNRFLTEKQSELFSTASNVETRDSPSRGGPIPTLEEQNKEASSVPLVASPNTEQSNNKQLYTATNEMQIEQITSNEDAEALNDFIKNDDGDGNSGTEVVRR